MAEDDWDSIPNWKEVSNITSFLLRAALLLFETWKYRVKDSMVFFYTNIAAELTNQTSCKFSDFLTAVATISKK